MLVALGRKFMALDLEFLAFSRELLDLQAVHQKCHLKVMAIEKIDDSPDADTVAIFTLCDQRHILLMHRLRRRDGRAALTLQRLVSGEVLRPNFPRHNERHTNLGFVWPLN